MPPFGYLFLFPNLSQKEKYRRLDLLLLPNIVNNSTPDRELLTEAQIRWPGEKLLSTGLPLKRYLGVGGPFSLWLVVLFDWLGLTVTDMPFGGLVSFWPIEWPKLGVFGRF